MGELKGRAKWLKKAVVIKKKKKKDITEDEEGAAESKKKEISSKKESMVSSKDHEAIRAPKSVIPVEGLTAALLNRKVQEIASSRGRRGTDARQLLRQFEGLSRLSMRFGPEPLTEQFGGARLSFVLAVIFGAALKSSSGCTASSSFPDFAGESSKY